jgi:hypothetical protein
LAFGPLLQPHLLLFGVIEHTGDRLAETLSLADVEVPFLSWIRLKAYIHWETAAGYHQRHTSH